jgi:hypothetical protein
MSSGALLRYLSKLSTTLRFVATVDFIAALCRLAVGQWPLAGGLVAAPVGFYGAWRLKSTPLFIYFVFACVQVLAIVGVGIAEVRQPLAMVLFGVQAIVQGGVAWYTYDFYKRLPHTSYHRDVALDTRSPP